MQVVFRDNSFALIGEEQMVVGCDAKKSNFRDMQGNSVVLDPSLDQSRIIIINTTPSIDNHLGRMQVSTLFETYGAKGNIEIITVTSDLPIAISQFKKTYPLYSKLQILSEYYQHEFSKKYGLLVNYWFFITRSVMVIKEGKIVYIEVPSDLSLPIDFVELSNFINKINA